MNKNEIIDTAFEAQCKLELIKTVIETLINMVEDAGEIKTPEQAMYFAIQTLDGLQKGGAE